MNVRLFTCFCSLSGTAIAFSLNLYQSYTNRHLTKRNASPGRRGVNALNILLLIFQRCHSAGFGTFPTLRGLPRDHRAVPSLALDESIQLYAIVSCSNRRVKMCQDILIVIYRFFMIPKKYRLISCSTASLSINTDFISTDFARSPARKTSA